LSAYQRIISNNSYAHDEQGVNPGQEKEDLMVSVADALISSVKVLATLT